MASLSPSARMLVKFFIPLFLLLFKACQAVPIKEPVSTGQNQNRHLSDHFSDTVKPLTQTFSHDFHSSMRQSHPSIREPPSLKAPDTHRNSIINPTRPFTRALQSEEPNQPHSRPAEKLSTVDYLSPPLRGTETRDRYALHMSSTEQKETPTIHESNTGHQQQKQGLSTGFNDPRQDLVENATHPNSASHFQSPIRTREDHDLLHHEKSNSETYWNRGGRTRDDIIQMSALTAGKRYNNPSPKYHDQNPFPTTGSHLEETRLSHEIENRRRRPIDVARDVLRKTTNFGRIMYKKVKSSIEGWISGSRSKSSSLPIVQEKRADGYSDEDVINLVNDIIKEIQMRSNDVGDHAKMLEKTDRWDPNDITRREHKVGMGNSPLLYMRTKVLVTPETLVDAVMSSTEKLFSSKVDKLPRKDMPKLLKEVQIRLAHVLAPAE